MRHSRERQSRPVRLTPLPTMAASDDDIERAATRWIPQHGDNAIVEARGMVETVRRNGDEDGADRWLTIIVAIGTQDDPPADARH